jgi:hypothetical protein
MVSVDLELAVELVLGDADDEVPSFIVVVVFVLLSDSSWLLQGDSYVS